jgi:hypothetical protein
MSTYALADERAKKVHERATHEYHRYIYLEHGLVLLPDDQPLAKQRVKWMEKALRMMYVDE